jgi:TetR/AcrR family transcriptional regulator, transcriptional repressor for nem operon
MARNREFDPKEALEKAMMVFWEKGYVDTSIDDLVNATGVSRYGLYGEFGSKHGLFLASLDHYQDTAVNAYFGIVERSGAAMADIRLYFDTLLNWYSQPAGKLGCLMCNSATEVAPHDKSVQKKVRGALDRMTSGFATALKNAKNRGEVRADLDVKQGADFLTGILLGASVMVRSGAGKQMIANTIKMSLSSL